MLASGFTPEPPRESAVPSPRAMTRTSLYALVAVQAIFAVAAPHDFAYLRTVLVVAQLGAAGAVVLAIAFGRDVRALLTERVRILHGLEHATAAVLEEQGDGAKTAEPDIEAAATAAIARVQAGERSLVYSPRCGTSFLVGWLLVATAVASVGAIALAMHLAHGYAFALTVVLVAVARRVHERIGLAAQRAVTVSGSFASARVVKVSREVSARGDEVTYWVHVEVEPVASTLAEPV
jgi:hypothetical protein